MLNHRSFGHNASGTANLVKYMERLPNMYKDHGLQILDDKHNFIGAGGSVLAPWKELVQQTPDYFEVTCSSVKKMIAEYVDPSHDKQCAATPREE